MKDFVISYNRLSVYHRRKRLYDEIKDIGGHSDVVAGLVVVNTEELAEQLHCSVCTLSSRFKAATGFSVIDYVIHCRVQQARALLAAGCSVQQAGESAGFGDSAHFTRTFRRITGLTPGQFSRSLRQ